jgi:hypothetical protein
MRFFNPALDYSREASDPHCKRETASIKKRGLHAAEEAPLLLLIF